jgi:hypothetical protein
MLIKKPEMTKARPHGRGWQKKGDAQARSKAGDMKTYLCTDWLIHFGDCDYCRTPLS